MGTRGADGSLGAIYAIEVDSRPGELEYERALAAAKKLDAAVVTIAAPGGGRGPDGWPF